MTSNAWFSFAACVPVIAHHAASKRTPNGPRVRNGARRPAAKTRSRPTTPGGRRRRAGRTTTGARGWRAPSATPPSTCATERRCALSRANAARSWKLGDTCASGRAGKARRWRPSRPSPRRWRGARRRWRRRRAGGRSPAATRRCWTASPGSTRMTWTNSRRSTFARTAIGRPPRPGMNGTADPRSGTRRRRWRRRPSAARRGPRRRTCPRRWRRGRRKSAGPGCRTAGAPATTGRRGRWRESAASRSTSTWRAAAGASGPTPRPARKATCST